MSRRRTYSALFVVILAAAFLPHLPARAQLAIPSSIHWNIKGNDNQNSNTVMANYLIGFVRDRNPRPLAVTLNEVCINQWNPIAANLQQIGYVHTFEPAISGITNLNTKCGDRYGNGVLWLGGYDGRFAHTYPAQGTGTIEKRNMVCGLALYPRFEVCTTHLIHDSIPIASQQLDDIKDWADWINSNNVDTYISGDLNMQYWQGEWYGSESTSIPELYEGYSEVDPNYRSTCCGSQPFKKIDYISVPKGRMSVTAPATIWTNALAISDHVLVQGYIAG